MSGESHDLGNVASLAALAGYGDGYVAPGDEIYVVTEDCDYIYRNTGTNPVADGFNIIKALFLPGVWERRGGSAGSTSLRFNTVATGLSGSGRLLDAGVSGLVDGVSIAWVESVKDSWRWDATSTLTADNITVCNPTANGANPGRFIRKLIPAPEWRQQAAWFVDTAGNDENDGTSALTPLQTDTEIGRRWGVGAQLSIPVTVTYANAPANETNYDVQILSGGSLTVQGTLTDTKTGIVLTAVQVQVRTAGSELGWAITGPTLGAADVGQLAIITASGTPANVGAYARILKDEGGGKVRVSPFGTFAASDSAPFVQITPLVGDTIKVSTPMTLKAGRLYIASGTRSATQATPSRQCAIFDSMIIDGGTPALDGVVESGGVTIFYARTILQNLTLVGFTSGTGLQRLCGGGWNSLIVNSGTLRIFQAGGTGSLTVNWAGLITLLADTYFQNCQVNAPPGSVVLSQGAAWWDRSVADSTVSVQEGGTMRQSGAVADWGTGNAGHAIRIFSTGEYIYAIKPTINGTLGAGREALIGGTDKQYGAVPFIEPTNNAALVLTA
jgi:hypothetical protein